jgi:chromosomal replication initiator protein
MDSFNDVWEKALSIIRDRITITSYESWIKLLRPIRFENDTAYIYAQSNFQKVLINNKFKDEIERALSEAMGFDVTAVILSEEDVSRKVSNPLQIKDAEDFKFEEKEIGNLNEELTFENFVVGDENKFAHAASIAVANNPAGAYNPFFIYGRSGLGKTHLLCAIANEIKKNRPESTIMLVKGEEFMNEIIQAIRNSQQAEFRNKYRYVDVFLVDDIQFISGKVSTELEFFHTFEALYEAKKQIIVTSDRPPKDMATLEDRLKTRFESGLIADIQPPEYETRVAIIKRKAESLSLNLSDDVVAYIATKLKNNVRELEGAVKKIKAYSLIFSDQPPSIGIIQNVIQSVIKENVNTTITPEMIVDHVSRYYNISKDDIYSAKRKAEILIARQVAMYITREMTDTSLSIIGDEFGGKNHSTVLHSIKVIEEKLETDSKFNQIIHEMMENIKKEF